MDVKLNYALRIIVLILSSITILIFIRALFFSTNGFEWGSVSDWLSTASSAGTLYIAYLAYKNAPSWINKRKHDSAFEIAKKLIIDDLPELENIVNTSASNTIDLEWKFDLFSKDPKYFLKHDECSDILKILDEQKQFPFLIKKELRRLSKLGWNLTTEAEVNIDEILNAFDTFYKMNYRAWSVLKNYLDERSSITVEYIEKNSMARINAVKEEKDKFDQNYQIFNDMHCDFDKYFKISTKNN
ncbi:TPA: hypothetical protein LSH92_004529 [Citrobacter koseri]|nr:hypothetical protein [Citrobacter koseri]